MTNEASLNQVTVIGVYEDAFENRGGKSIVIRTASGQHVVAGVWAKSAEQAQTLVPGQQIMASGFVKSRSYEGKWFTDFSASFVRPFGEANQDPFGEANQDGGLL